MKILVKFPTRQRPARFLQTLGLYISMADNLGMIRFIITADLDDITMNNDEMRSQLARLPVDVCWGKSKTKIQACNADIPHDDWDILVLASDDMLPRVAGWDSIIRQKMTEHHPDLDGVLNFHDGHQGDKINTLPVMGRKWYNRFNYIYNPIYETMYCDTELTEVSRLLNREAYLPEVIIEHQHPYSGAVPFDDLYIRNNDASMDLKAYNARKAANFYIPKVLIIQPGRTGDILITLPIAKQLHDQNCQVSWYCPKEYHDIFNSIDYCKPVEKHIATDRVIDLSFGFGGSVEAWWQANKQNFDSFVTAKYYLAQVGIQQRWNLSFKRHPISEDTLYQLVAPKETPYTLVHEQTHLGKFIDVHAPDKIPFVEYPGFNIFEWYKVIDQAREIHCIDSALANFIEAVPEWRNKKKHLYISIREQNTYLRSIYKNNWIYE